MPMLPSTLTAQDAVESLTDFFGTRLLLKPYRRGVRGPATDEVLSCERAFAALVEKAVEEVMAGAELDAVRWVSDVASFSADWMGVCHWLSPRKFRQLLTETVGAVWAKEDEIVATSERPPMDMKWYRVTAGADTSPSCLCVVCSVVCNSLPQYKVHASGKAHKAQARAWSRRNGGAPAPEPLLMKSGAGGNPAREACLPYGPCLRMSRNSSESTLLSATSSLPSTPSSVSSRTRSLPESAGLPATRRASSASSENASLDSALSTALEAEPPVTIETRRQVAQLESALARLPLGRAKAFALAASLASSRASELAVNAILDAAVQAEDAGPVAAVAVGVARGDRRFRTLLAAAVGRRAAASAVDVDSDSDDGVLDEASCGFAGMYECGDAAALEAAQARARQDGLVCFASALVRHGVLPVSALLRCLEMALQDASAAGMASACRAVSGAWSRVGGADARALRVLFAGALAGRHYPRYVKEMVAPFLC
eukprot:TRINITY_DN348_c0_g2_i8.p1 TRINITY_DN348_c0_g2~~TRINITY_DN348_c0_g2_i8.p1  ORF type:complete len:486 (+),score=171.68 TRINITY_DN348_c0_g2_i8:58-1515(+)